MRIAALVKQIPKFEDMELGPDGRLRRDGIELEMNAYCRRAVSKAVELASAPEHAGSSVTVITLGPPSAEDALREAIAWGMERGVDITGVLVTDPAFAGSDTLATARALAAAIEHEGPFDLVLTGRNSVDADTGQVGPELAELLGLPFLTGVRFLSVVEDRVEARCEHDDGWLQAEVPLPAILSCAERLCEPAKVDPEGRAAVPADRVRRLAASDLGAGPWGQDASPTSVGEVKVLAHERLRHRNPDAPLAEQVRDAVQLLVERGALHDSLNDSALNGTDANIGTVPETPATDPFDAPLVAVVVEPDRAHATRELLGAAARLAREIDGDVVAVTVRDEDAALLSSWGADAFVRAHVDNVEESVAYALAQWASATEPWAVLTGSTAWGREVASRAAARLGAGLTGDAVDLEVSDGRLVAWKPAFGGQLVAAITASSRVQMATVRAGVLPTPAPRDTRELPSTAIMVEPLERVRVLARTRDDDLEVLADAHAVIGVGTGVAPDDYDKLEPLRTLLGAELGATRKVTDKGWLPRSRQIGITGRAIAPRLFVSIGASGKFNHVIGVRAAGTVLAINPDPNALVFDAADAGIVGDWSEVVPLLVAELDSALAGAR
ncbi:MAG: electron transfer flavoprotein beta subunit [Actinomycetia bacterium]|nr:electron transfer flavoprotein beta subunit [Actinomycetes bacterium]